MRRVEGGGRRSVGRLVAKHGGGRGRRRGGGRESGRGRQGGRLGGYVAGAAAFLGWAGIGGGEGGLPFAEGRLELGAGLAFFDKVGDLGDSDILVELAHVQITRTGLALFFRPGLAFRRRLGAVGVVVGLVLLRLPGAFLAERIAFRCPAPVWVLCPVFCLC
jgi:hypothetical protein